MVFGPSALNSGIDSPLAHTPKADQHHRPAMADRSQSDSPGDHRDRDDLVDGAPLSRANSTEWGAPLAASYVVGADGLKVADQNRLSEVCVIARCLCTTDSEQLLPSAASSSWLA